MKNYLARIYQSIFTIILFLVNISCSANELFKTEWIKEIENSDLDGIVKALLHDDEILIAGQGLNKTIIWQFSKGGLPGDTIEPLNGFLMEIADFSVSESGEKIVAGHYSGKFNSLISSKGQDGFIAKFDVENKLVWIKQFGSENDDIVSGFVLYEGIVYLTGFKILENSNELFIIRINNENGEVIGETTIQDAAGLNIDILANNLILSGASWENVSREMYPYGQIVVLKCDLLGNIIKQTKLENRYNGYVSDQYIGSDGGIYLTGELVIPIGNGTTEDVEQGCFVAKFDKNCHTEFIRVLENTSKGNSIVVDIGRNIYITGYSPQKLTEDSRFVRKDFFLIKTNLEGVEIARKIISTSEDDEGRAIVIDEEGAIFVIGYTTGELFGEPSEKTRRVFIIKFVQRS